MHPHAYIDCDMYFFRRKEVLCSRPLIIHMHNIVHTEYCMHACTVVRRDLESQHEACVTCAKIQHSNCPYTSILLNIWFSINMHVSGCKCTKFVLLIWQIFLACFWIVCTWYIIYRHAEAKIYVVTSYRCMLLCCTLYFSTWPTW